MLIRKIDEGVKSLVIQPEDNIGKKSGKFVLLALITPVVYGVGKVESAYHTVKGEVQFKVADNGYLRGTSNLYRAEEASTKASSTIDAIKQSMSNLSN